MTSSNSSEDLDFATLAVKRIEIQNPVYPVVPPIYTSSTYILESAKHGAALCEQLPVDNGQSKYLYSRWGNPTTDVVREAISKLEGAIDSFALSSGMAAISNIFMTFLKQGDHVIAPLCVYGGTHEVLDHIMPKFGVEVSFVDANDVNNYERAIKSNTKLLYGETPANPTMSLLDLKRFAEIGKKANAITVVDSTFASPYNQQPLKLGIDVVLHSATKYLGGHSDLIAGVVSFASIGHAEAFWKTMKLFGNQLSPFDAFLLQRGMKTIDVRVARHNENAMAVAKFLEGHEKVQRVFYPGLPSHPQHELAVKQMTRGFGGMIAFEVKGGVEAGRKLIENVRLINLAVSLGGVESLIEHAASMTHTMVDRETRLKGGITDGLIRFSVGLESIRDLIDDLNQALEKI